MAGEYVYFIRELSGNKSIKIGCSDDPVSRKAMLKTGNSSKLEVMHFMDGGKDLESELHARFKKCWTGEGEWFHASLELLMYIAECKAQSFNRKICYRAWDFEREEYFNIHRLDFNEGPEIASYRDKKGRVSYKVDKRFLVGRDILLLEHTGIFDSFSHDIFEKDVLFYSPFYPDVAEGKKGFYIVNYRKGAFWLDSVDPKTLEPDSSRKSFPLCMIDEYSYSKTSDQVLYTLLYFGSYHNWYPEDVPKLAVKYGLSL